MASSQRFSRLPLPIQIPIPVSAASPRAASYGGIHPMAQATKGTQAPGEIPSANSSRDPPDRSPPPARTPLIVV